MQKAVLYSRSLFDLDSAHDAALRIHIPFNIRLQEGIENNMVGVDEPIIAGDVKPPTPEKVACDLLARLQKLLDGIGYLQLATPGRSYPRYSFVYLGGEEVNADYGQVALGCLGLFDQMYHFP